MARQAEQDPTNLYIANLPHTIKENDLENMFSQYGRVSYLNKNQIIKMRHSSLKVIIILVSVTLLNLNISWCQKYIYRQQCVQYFFYQI